MGAAHLGKGQNPVGCGWDPITVKLILLARGRLLAAREVDGELGVGGFASGAKSKELEGSELDPLVLTDLCEPMNGCPALRFCPYDTPTFGMGGPSCALACP